MRTISSKSHVSFLKQKKIVLDDINLSLLSCCIKHCCWELPWQKAKRICSKERKWAFDGLWDLFILWKKEVSHYTIYVLEWRNLPCFENWQSQIDVYTQLSKIKTIYQMYLLGLTCLKRHIWPLRNKWNQMFSSRGTLASTLLAATVQVPSVGSVNKLIRKKQIVQVSFSPLHICIPSVLQKGWDTESEYPISI